MEAEAAVEVDVSPDMTMIEATALKLLTQFSLSTINA